MSRPEGDAHILWMERDGELYSPEMPLSRASLDLIERDIWNGTYAGVCRAVYSYGTHANGGGYCREVTQEVAARLGEMSFAGRDAVKAPVRAFLEAMGVAFAERRPLREEAEAEPFEMIAPPEPVARARRAGARKRMKALTPAELRAQPQLKLPIAGGKSAEGPAKDRLVIESQRDEDAGVDSVSLKDTRSLAEQRASWERFRAMMRSWKAPADADARPGAEADHKPARAAGRL
jgi:hypothetical protein